MTRRKKNVPGTDSFKGVRAFYGMSQDEMAVYLKVNRSQLNMAERDERKLPHDALLKFAELEKHLYENVIDKNPTLIENERLSQSLDKQHRNLKVIATKKIRQYKYVEQLTEKALTELQEKKKQAQNFISLLPVIQEKMLPDHEPLYNIIHNNAYRNHLRYGFDKEIKLEARLAGLRAEMKILEEYYSQEIYDDLYNQFEKRKAINQSLSSEP